LLVAALISGCKLPCADKPYPHDPLFESKPPLEQKAAAAASPVVVAAAVSDPKPPSFPQTLVASPAPFSKPDAIGPGTESLAARPMATLRQPVTAIPAVRRQFDEEVHQAAIYAYAPDYSWLEGTLEKHYEGHYALRYCEPTVPDRWGGKVLLNSDPRLADFHDGDVVRVEGVLLAGLDLAALAANGYPRYRIREVRPASLSR
jgi:hypothetical protein